MLVHEQTVRWVYIVCALEQCFQEYGLIKRKNFVSAHCPNKVSRTYKNLLECQQDYLKVLESFPNAGSQLICWIHTMQIPALMPRHEHMCQQVTLSLKMSCFHSTIFLWGIWQHHKQKESYCCPQMVSIHYETPWALISCDWTNHSRDINQCWKLIGCYCAIPHPPWMKQIRRGKEGSWDKEVHKQLNYWEYS